MMHEYVKDFVKPIPMVGSYLVAGAALLTGVYQAFQGHLTETIECGSIAGGAFGVGRICEDFMSD